MTPEEEIKEIEEEIHRTPYNKATQKHIGILKAKLAKLRGEREKSKKKSGPSYAVKKSGDATVLLVGFPSVGKSTLLNRITSADSKIGDYDFTTLDIIPGVMEYNGAKIQVLDIPGVIEGVSSGRGRGKEILSVVRNADLILMMVDAKNPEQLKTIKNELYSAGFRLDENPPDIRITKKSRGGIGISSTKSMSKADRETVKSVLHEFKIVNADVLIREEFRIDRLIDSVAKNRVYVPSIVLINKIDMVEKAEKLQNSVQISALKGKNIDILKEKIWEKLKLMRIYMKKIGKEPDLRQPLIVKKNSDIKCAAEKIHRDFARNFTYARVWGKSARFPGQKVGMNHVLSDGDIVELHEK